MVRLAAEAERRAADELRRADDSLAAASQQLRTIEGYLEEYAARARDAVVGEAGRIHSERRFVTQLERDVQTQRDNVQRCRQQLEAARARWLSSRLKREGLEDVLARRARAEAYRRESREQQRLDDLHRPAPWG